MAAEYDHKEFVERWMYLAKRYDNPNARLSAELGIPVGTISGRLYMCRLRGELPDAGGRGKRSMRAPRLHPECPRCACRPAVED